jgi:hypothetical protein
VKTRLEERVKVSDSGWRRGMSPGIHALWEYAVIYSSTCPSQEIEPPAAEKYRLLPLRI